MALRPDLGFVARLRSDLAGGALVRWLLPATVLVPLVGWLGLRGELAGLFDSRVGVALFAAVNVVALGAVAWFASTQADQLDRARARSLASLSESEARLRLAIQGPGIGIAEQDRDLRYTFMDMSVPETSAGRSRVLPEMFIGKTDQELFGTDPDFTAAKVAVVATGESLHREVPYGWAGTERWFEVWVVPRRNDSGETIGLLSSFIDITERRDLDLQLRHSQRMEAIGQLTGGIAHDFNNLLAVVLGNLELLQDPQAAAQLGSELLLDAIHAARRGAELTHRLLAFSRRQQLAPTVLDAGTIIHELMVVLRRLTEESIRIETNLAPDLWPIRIDATQLENALLNLAVNARDAMPKGGCYSPRQTAKSTASTLRPPRSNQARSFSSRSAIPGSACQRMLSRVRSSHFSRPNRLGRELASASAWCMGLLNNQAVTWPSTANRGWVRPSACIFRVRRTVRTRSRWKMRPDRASVLLRARPYWWSKMMLRCAN